MDGRGLVQELRSRHTASTAPTSRALVATIDALTETLEAAGTDSDLLSYVGACVSSLDSVSSIDDAPVIGAVCTLLATLLPHVAQQQTRSIFLRTTPVVCKITSLLYEAADVAGVKWAAQVLAQLLCCPDTEATWAPVKAPLLLLVRIAMHSNAKARKMAQEGLSRVLGAYEGGPSHRPASEEIEQGTKHAHTLFLSSWTCYIRDCSWLFDIFPSFLIQATVGVQLRRWCWRRLTWQPSKPPPPLNPSGRMQKRRLYRACRTAYTSWGRSSCSCHISQGQQA